MHYLITGHTGFKGSWLSLMLQMQGHTVSGISLDPSQKSLFNDAHLNEIFKYDLRLDIRNSRELAQAVKKVDPEVIIHLAAQPLVRESYKDPVGTFETNVLGTLNLLEASKGLTELKATLIITTDKVYKNRNHLRGYVETDELGGDDPYSASKAAADIAAQSWIKNFALSPVAIARAGNVIGGGDWAQDRIIPDIVNAYSSGRLPTLRYPRAVRPWQHVLDCLSGYLKLINQLAAGGCAGEWNFGPELSEKHSVSDLVSTFADCWGIPELKWNLDTANHLQESSFLLLDSSKAREELAWKDKLSFEQTVAWVCSWYQQRESSPIDFTRDQISNFFEIGPNCR